MSKTRLNYTIRSTRAPGEQTDTIVPVIVDRFSPVELAAVVENCIDRGLIAGLKPTAARGIAEGVASQIAREFSLGRGVKFGNFFYGRPYLSGTTDANGRLTSANSINVRLYKGEAFKLTRDDFAFTFDGAGDAVKVDFILGDTTNPGGNTRGTVVPNAPVRIEGRNLYGAGDTNKVVFDDLGGTGKVEVTEFTWQGESLLTFAWPGALVAGKSYTVTVERTDPNGVTRTSSPKVVTVKEGATPPGPTPVGPTVTAINDGTFHAGAGNVITGANMRFADAFPGNHILIKDAQGTDMEAMISTDAEIPVTETRFALNLDEGQPLTDGEEYTFEFDMVDADGQPVTVTSKARWQAS